MTAMKDPHHPHLTDCIRRRSIDFAYDCDCGADLNKPSRPPATRVFDTGAYRDTSADKLSYLRHLSPMVLRRYVQFLHRMRQMPDGTVREPDNWKNGFPKDESAESLLRHVMELWLLNRGEDTLHPRDARDPQDAEEVVCSILFNASCYLHALLMERKTA